MTDKGLGELMPVISVIVPIYRVEKYICCCIDSILAQTLACFELILVDDGSTDKSSAVCDEYRKKYPENVVVIHKENGRQASARNEGLKYVQGKFVNFMDPDDTLEKTAMEKVFSFMKDLTSATSAEFCIIWKFCSTFLTFHFSYLPQQDTCPCPYYKD